MKLNIQLFGLDQWISNNKGDEIYLRKVNAVHGFFVKHGYNDDLQGTQHVTKKTIQELIDTIKMVLSNHNVAEELLPTYEGFFFGGYSYDEYYFEELERLLPQLEDLIKPSARYYYHAWW